MGHVIRSWILKSVVAAGLLLPGLCVAACGVARGESTASGRELYGACESCHGSAGEGNVALGAPTIASLPRWYLANQLQRFQTGTRGKHPDDVEGLRMRAMSLQMLSEAEVNAVSAYVAELPRAVQPAALTAADPTAGEQFYIVCTPCHGAQGEGNEEVKSPPLAGLDDWYVALQIRKFQAGVRGRAEDDILGLPMVAMAGTVPPESVDNLAAYIRTFSK